MLFMLSCGNKRCKTQYREKRIFKWNNVPFSVALLYCTPSFLKLGLRINPWVATL